MVSFREDMEPGLGVKETWFRNNIKTEKKT
jgi:hypothetical protein